jgi:hypothetical protein
MKIVVLVVVLALAGCGGNPASEEQPPEAAVPEQPPLPPPDEAAAIAALREVNESQDIYFRRNRRYALTYEELIESLFLREEPAVTRTGYDIRLRPRADAASYSVLAVPATPSSSARHFFTDQTGEIRAEQGKDATAESPVISD